MPTVTSADRRGASQTYYLFGNPANAWPPTTGTVWANPTGGYETSREDVSIYRGPDTAVGNDLVFGQRITTVACDDAATKVVRFTVRVEYTYMGKNYNYEMYTLRAPDRLF